MSTIAQSIYLSEMHKQHQEELRDIRAGPIPGKLGVDSKDLDVMDRHSLLLESITTKLAFLGTIREKNIKLYCGNDYLFGKFIDAIVRLEDNNRLNVRYVNTNTKLNQFSIPQIPVATARSIKIDLAYNIGVENLRAASLLVDEAADCYNAAPGFSTEKTYTSTIDSAFKILNEGVFDFDLKVV